MIEMTEKFPAVSEDQIAAFERKLGRPFPPQYRKFLLLTNGGAPAEGRVRNIRIRG